MQEIEGGSQLSNSTVIAGHVVESHCLTKFVVGAEFFRLFKQLNCGVDVLTFQIVDGENVADFTKLLAGFRELNGVKIAKINKLTSLLFVPKFAFLIIINSSSTPIASTYLDCERK